VNPTCVCLLSGGMDSAALLWHLIRQGEQPVCLAVDYGQKAVMELTAARALAHAAGAPLYCLRLPLAEFASSALTDLREPIPPPEESARARTIVPFRNAHLLLWAATVGAHAGCERVFYGATKEDAALYPDCRQPFALALEGALSLGLPGDQEVKLHSPWFGRSKAQVLCDGLILGVPYALTWSCYRGTRAPCGACDACASRAAAFAEVGLEDPGLVGLAR
jgi:7-cyano-7-deazaguanine synthase